MRPVGTCALHPLAKGRFGQVEVARDPADALPVIEHQANRLRFEVIIKLPARAALAGLCVGRDIVSTFRKMSRNRISPMNESTTISEHDTVAGAFAYIDSQSE
jgi:hypothetical protein